MSRSDERTFFQFSTTPIPNACVICYHSFSHILIPSTLIYEIIVFGQFCIIIIIIVIIDTENSMSIDNHMGGKPLRVK